ncbi:hypothetical protein GO755_26800 [Spirosoma sp. HMF4905]|uniref:Uncharacterized protein n=1 Tax=Spirosoma arboris TaxID=2682092 RepID=A0A7K1SIN3_9BACT|nr:hypothetical protein [Spirosoma arboris]MVM33677.1 hypothetical protein [Spirosoma arboris]
MSDKELLAFSKAYHKLITRGMGPGFTIQAEGLGLFILDQRAGYTRPTKFPKVKNLLISALSQLLRTTHYKAFQLQMAAWQQTILSASSSKELGQFCVHLAELLFPPGEEESIFTGEKGLQ